MPTAAGLYYALSEGGSSQQPCVVLLHGVGGNHRCWPPELRRLNGRRVLAPDLPGHGYSPGTGRQSIELYAQDVLEFLLALDIHEVVLVGHDMGGAVALSLAHDHPGLVVGLGLVSSGAYLGVPLHLMELFSSQVTIPLGWQAFQEMAFSPQSRQTLVERSMGLLREVRPGVLLCDWRACYSFDIRNQVSQINAPGWIATGADDRLTPLSFARFLSTQLPEARLQVVPSAGHMAIQEQPQELAGGLRSFLEELEPSLDRYMQA